MKSDLRWVEDDERVWLAACALAKFYEGEGADEEVWMGGALVALNAATRPASHYEELLEQREYTVDEQSREIDRLRSALDEIGAFAGQRMKVLTAFDEVWRIAKEALSDRTS